jgi:hypothetical protein
LCICIVNHHAEQQCPSAAFRACDAEQCGKLVLLRIRRCYDIPGVIDDDAATATATAAKIGALIYFYL